MTHECRRHNRPVEQAGSRATSEGTGDAATARLTDLAERRRPEARRSTCDGRPPAEARLQRLGELTMPRLLMMMMSEELTVVMTMTMATERRRVLDVDHPRRRET